MSRFVPTGAMVVIAGLLSGCVSYSIVGTFEDSGRAFIGMVSVSLTDTGTIEVATVDGTVTCSGTSVVTKKPSSFSGTGAQGSATAQCSDGSGFKVDFIQTRNSGGHGQGIDDRGNIVKVFFDTSKERAEMEMKSDKLNSLTQ